MEPSSANKYKRLLALRSRYARIDVRHIPRAQNKPANETLDRRAQ